MRRRGGFLLILALLIAVLLLVATLGMLSRQSARYERAQLMADAAQARGLALAGLEEARMKLERDLLFPPLSESTQELFTFSEVIEDTTGERVGAFTITLDFSQAEQYGILLITSTGEVGMPERVRGRRSVRAELQLSTFKIVNFEDFGAP